MHEDKSLMCSIQLCPNNKTALTFEEEGGHNFLIWAQNQVL